MEIEIKLWDFEYTKQNFPAQIKSEILRLNEI